MKMLHRVGYVYDKCQWEVEFDLTDYLAEHPEWLGLDELPKIKDYRMVQDNYEGVTLPLHTEDGETIRVGEDIIKKALSNIYQISINQVFLHAGEEIVYMLTLQGVEQP